MLNNVLVVGYGSVGKKYANAFNAQKYNVLVFDPYTSSEIYTSFKTWSDLFDNHQCIDNIILSDFAETRYFNLINAMALKPKKVLLEKIITNNLKHAREIKNISEESVCIFGTHLRWEILELDKYIKQLASENELGKFCALNVTAGNSCLSVGGAHWIGLYLQMTDKIQDIHVQSNISQSYDSPRSKTLSVLSGNVQLFSNNGDLNLIFHRKSRIAPNACFLFEGGYITFSIDGELTVNSVADFSNLKPHQYKIPSVILSKKIIFEDIFQKIAKDWEATELPSVGDGLRVSEILLAALQNNGLKASGLDKIINDNPGIEYPIT